MSKVTSYTFRVVKYGYEYVIGSIPGYGLRTFPRLMFPDEVALDKKFLITVERLEDGILQADISPIE